MAETRLLKLLSSLEVQFDAAVAREEDEAASDLALSLRQGLLLRNVLRRGSWVARVDGVAWPVVLVGRDYVACAGPETVLIPERRLVLHPSGTGEKVPSSSVPLVETLRALCRSSARAVVKSGEMALDGRLVQVGPDHLALTTAAGITFLALEAIDLIRLTDLPEPGLVSGAS